MGIEYHKTGVYSKGMKSEADVKRMIQRLVEAQGQFEDYDDDYKAIGGAVLALQWAAGFSDVLEEYVE